MLKRLANILKESVRDVDTVARYGGEEFTVILPEAPAAEAARVGERIRSRVEAARFSPADGVAETGVTVSIGLAKGRSCFSKLMGVFDSSSEV